MPNLYFQFKQFTIRQDKCAMKVGTDGVLLGAWTKVDTARKVLDIGTGTGLLALMAAQRCNAEIWAIEIDRLAVEEAMENVKNSSWSSRIHLIEGDFRTWKPDMKYDLIMTNPPYFKNSLKSPDIKRTIARHTEELSFDELIKGVVELLQAEGKFSVILPANAEAEFKERARKYGLFVCRQTKVRTVPVATPKRVLMEFGFASKGAEKIISDELIIELSRHHYSEKYKELTKDFYLFSSVVKQVPAFSKK